MKHHTSRQNRMNTNSANPHLQFFSSFLNKFFTKSSYKQKSVFQIHVRYDSSCTVTFLGEKHGFMCSTHNKPGRMVLKLIVNITDWALIVEFIIMSRWVDVNCYQNGCNLNKASNTIIKHLQASFVYSVKSALHSLLSLCPYCTHH